MRFLTGAILAALCITSLALALPAPTSRDAEPAGTPMQPIGLSGSGQNDAAADSTAPPPQAQLVRDTLSFTVTLYNLLARDPGNVVFSPFDIARSMAILHAGAQAATLSEIRKVMQWEIAKEDLDSGFQQVEEDLGSGSALHLKDALAGNIKLTIPEAYHIELLDRKANAPKWIKDQTDQHVDINEPFHQPGTTVVTTLSLASKWGGEGKKRGQAKRHYRARSGEVLNLRTLTDDARLRYFETAQFKLVELKYEGDRFGLVIWLPRDDTVSLKTSPAADDLHDMIAQLAPTRVQVALPVFAINSTFRLRKPLNELGLAVALGQNADFSRWGPGAKALSVRDILHKARIEVDERTTNADAATTVKLQGNEAKVKIPKPGKLLDKPFLFMVRDTVWGMPLLFGRVEAAM